MKKDISDKLDEGWNTQREPEISVGHEGFNTTG